MKPFAPAGRFLETTLTSLGVSSAAQTVLDDASVTAMRATLGVMNQLPIMISGQYYSPRTHGDGTADASVFAVSVDVLRLSRFIVETDTTFDRIGLECTTLAAGGKARVGVYADNAGIPDGSALIVESGELDMSSTGLKVSTINQALTRGIYWVAGVSGVLASAVPLSFNGTGRALSHGTGGLNAHTPGRSAAHAYAALPATCPATSLVAFCPMVVIRKT